MRVDGEKSNWQRQRRGLPLSYIALMPVLGVPCGARVLHVIWHDDVLRCRAKAKASCIGYPFLLM